MRNILITGASGFIGQAVVAELSRENFSLLVCARSELKNNPDILLKKSIITPIHADTDWRDVLNDVDVIVHLAGKAHSKISKNVEEELTQVNVAGTLNLAQQAADNGVKRFVFLSSIKVNGETTLPCQPFSADDLPAPKDLYAVSKLNAEQGLRRISEKSAMEYVTIRSPLVYGPGVKANFFNLIRCVHYGLPLPFAKISNQRSLVAITNLTDLIKLCLTHPAAANQTLLVCDGYDFSTPELIKHLALSLGVKPNLLPIPEILLAGGLSAIGQKTVFQRLCSNLQVDMAKTRKLLAWTPPAHPYSVLRETTSYYLKSSC